MVDSGKKLEHLSTFEAARLVGVDMATVIDWCEQKKLPAFKTPGGHRRISPRDLFEFLIKYKMPIPAELSHLGRVRCLIVDDDPTILKVLSRLIKTLDPNIEIHLAVDGYEAGAKAFEIFPHIVILDLGLPGIDGFKVCQHLRADDRFKNTKILAVTGFNSVEAREKILKAGADEYLAKPFEMKALKAVLFRLLGREVKP